MGVTEMVGNRGQFRASLELETSPLGILTGSRKLSKFSTKMLRTSLGKHVKYKLLDQALEHFHLLLAKRNASLQDFSCMVRLLLDIDASSSKLSLEERYAKALDVYHSQEDFKHAYGLVGQSDGIQTLFVRALIDFQIPDKMKKAKILIQKMKSRNVPIKMRTLDPLLKAACDEEELELAFEIWEMAKGLSAPYADWEASDFAKVNLLQQKISGSPNWGLCIHEKQHLHMLNLCASKNPELIEEILQHMQEFFFVGQRGYFMERPEGEGHLEVFARIFDGRNGRIQAHFVKIKRGESYCHSCQRTHRSPGLSLDEKKLLRTNVLKLLAYKRVSHCLDLAKFANFLKEKGSENVTAIIDGANVGYNSGPTFSVDHIEMLRCKLEEEGEKVIIVLPHRYLMKGKKFGKTVIGEQEQKIYDKWNSKSQMFAVSHGDDDWYWLYAGVAFDDINPYVVTNDEMRDHSKLLPSRIFSKMKETQMMRFKQGLKEVNLIKPAIISRQICEFSPGNWHIPNLIGEENSAEQEEWLCLDLESATNENCQTSE